MPNPWKNDLLQALGTIGGFYLTIVIFLYSKEDSDNQFKEYIYQQQLSTSTQIHAVQASSQSEIENLQKVNSEHLQEVARLTQIQIANLNELTQKQIDALHLNTQKQISSFEKQTLSIANELKENSTLLAEILLDQLEKSLRESQASIATENRRFKNLQDWKLLRTNEERKHQLQKQLEGISKLNSFHGYLLDKYLSIRKYLGFSKEDIED